MRPWLVMGCAVFLAFSASVAHGWRVCTVHPFVEATADELASAAPGLSPADVIRLDGAQNDWVLAAALITAAQDEQAVVKVTLSGEEALLNHVTIRPVGFVNRRCGEPPRVEWSLDVIFNRPEHDFAPDHVERIKKHVRNVENLASWPVVKVAAQDPVVLWFTADTRGLAPGLYTGALEVEAEDGTKTAVPLRLTVRNVTLPARNTLRTLAWQCIFEMPTKADFARYLLDYGINVTWAWWYDDDIACREAGWDFFLYTFAPAWSGKFPEEYEEAAALAEVEKLRERIARLGLAADQWALCLRDEPNDEEAPRQAAWCRWLRERWPEAAIWCNVPWGPGPKNEWVSVDGLIRTLQPYVDIWCPYSHNLWDEQSAAMMPALRERSREVWFYEIMNTDYARRPDVGRGLYRTLGWMAWRYGLRGCAWFSLNDYPDWPWLEDGRTYSAMYYTMPTRALEAVRQGLVEYTLLSALRQHGAPPEVADDFCARLFAARGPEDLDAVKTEIYDTLERLAKG